MARVCDQYFRFNVQSIRAIHHEPDRGDTFSDHIIAHRCVMDADASCQFAGGDSLPRRFAAYLAHHERNKSVCVGHKTDVNPHLKAIVRRLSRVEVRDRHTSYSVQRMADSTVGKLASQGRLRLADDTRIDDLRSAAKELGVKEERLLPKRESRTAA